jgi:hypothetical protein
MHETFQILAPFLEKHGIRIVATEEESITVAHDDWKRNMVLGAHDQMVSVAREETSHHCTAFYLFKEDSLEKLLKFLHRKGTWTYDGGPCS